MQLTTYLILVNAWLTWLSLKYRFVNFCFTIDYWVDDVEKGFVTFCLLAIFVSTSYFTKNSE